MIYRVLLLVWIPVFLASCGDESSTKASSTTKLLSAELGASILNAPVFDYLLPSSYRDPLQNSAVTVSSGVSTVTVSSFTGKIHYIGLLVLGSDSGYSVGPIGGNDDEVDPSDDTAYVSTALEDIDLSQGLSNTAGFTCCGGTPYPQSNPVIDYVHIYAGYLEFGFTLASSDGVHANLQASHVLRVVFADISDTEMKKGDLMYRESSSSTTYWCVSGSGCTSETRPSSPVQISSIANFSPESSQGNQTIPDFSIRLEDGHAAIPMLQADLENAALTWTFNLDVNLAGLTFNADLTDTATIDTIIEMVEAFQMNYFTPGSTTSGETMTATVTVTKS